MRDLRLGLPDRLADETRVVGSVFLWGRIVRGEGLYRAEFAYPRELYVTPRLGRRRRLRRPAALRAYGVPIRVVPSYAELRTRSPRAGGFVEILAAVPPGSPSVGSELHGLRHWTRVARVGRELARETRGANVAVVEAFAALHDSQRRADRNDRDHGARAALVARRLRKESVLEVDDAELDVLCYALRHHDRGWVTSNPTIGCAWDADRLDLPRVGIAPALELLSTAAARRRVEPRRAR